MDGDEALVLARSYIKKNMKESEACWGDIKGELSSQMDLYSVINSKQSLFQVTTMPEHVDSGTIVQYIGLTNSKYITGYFYRCIGVDDEEQSIWEYAKLQPEIYSEFIGTLDEYSRVRRTIDNDTKCWIIDEYNNKIVSLILKQSTGDIVLSIPTLLSQLVNDCNYIKKDTEALDNYYKKTETYTQQQVKDLVSAVNSIKYKVVTELPVGEEISISTIYLIKSEDEDNSIYTQWMSIDGEWSSLGNTKLSLTNYVSAEDFKTFKKTVEDDLKVHNEEISKLSDLLDKINNKVVE